MYSVRRRKPGLEAGSRGSKITYLIGNLISSRKSTLMHLKLCGHFIGHSYNNNNNNKSLGLVWSRIYFRIYFDEDNIGGPSVLINKN